MHNKLKKIFKGETKGMMQNHLHNQTSPYLLQHADNPVNWYPWCEEAFEQAQKEDKPIFLSIGYSTCHWCHVMAHESFEDKNTAKILNQYYISIKVDKEERPDIDSIYMSVCQAFTGSGGWPTTVFLTPEQKPFFAGTYFPKTSRYGRIGLKELLLAIHQQWVTNRQELMDSAEEVISALKQESSSQGEIDTDLIRDAFEIYKRTFDHEFGGFGSAPKFPTPHNLLFLMQYYEKMKENQAMKMVETTLMQMYRGGMFDHIGGGFSRYSTDRYFLVPHFEKMLYDNALLILAYSRAYQITKKSIYCEVAEKTASYIIREMTFEEGGFYSAQDADSEGVEGKYYLLQPEEVIQILGKQIGDEFNQYYDITKAGNFEGKNIPNLLQTKKENKKIEESLQSVYEQRKKRYPLHLDDKILTNWNGLMIAAMCSLYRITENEKYLEVAKKAQNFIQNNLSDGKNLYTSFRSGKHSGKAFLDDYANEIFALLALYEATLESKYLDKAKQFCKKVIADFHDNSQGGFFLYGEENEQLILRPKETYDGAVFSGNSAMAYNLVRLYLLTGETIFGEFAKKQLEFMSAQAKHYPAGYAMFLIALSDYLEPPTKVTVVVKNGEDLKNLSCQLSLQTIIVVIDNPTKEYTLKNNKTTYYICEGHTCQAPVNEIPTYLLI